MGTEERFSGCLTYSRQNRSLGYQVFRRAGEKFNGCDWEEVGGTGCPAPGEGSPKAHSDSLRVAAGPLDWLMRKGGNVNQHRPRKPGLGGTKTHVELTYSDPMLRLIERMSEDTTYRVGLVYRRWDRKRQTRRKRFRAADPFTTTLLRLCGVETPPLREKSRRENVRTYARELNDVWVSSTGMLRKRDFTSYRHQTGFRPPQMFGLSSPWPCASSTGNMN